MKAVSIGPSQAIDKETRDNYFKSLDESFVDIAYVQFHIINDIQTNSSLVKELAAFASEAKTRGFQPCVQLSSILYAGTNIGIEEAQFDYTNSPIHYGDNGLYMSLSSDAWCEYLKDMITLLVANCGFDWIVFDEPYHYSNIPGTKDRLYSRIQRDYPDLIYPTGIEETTEYILVQEEQSQAALDLYKQLASHAKSAGATWVGAAPCSFFPAHTKDPKRFITSCGISKLAYISDIDFLVAAIKPVVELENEFVPEIVFSELIAHSQGKPVLAAIALEDLECEKTSDISISTEALRNVAFTALGASVNGFITDCSVGYEGIRQIADTVNYSSRLGWPSSPVAFVFSNSVTHHAPDGDDGWKVAFSRYLSFIRQMTFKSHMPILTFHAETLKRDLEEHPETQVLIFEEHFPMTVEQMMVIRKWWQEPEKHAIVAFGSGLGFSADANLPGPQPTVQSLPGVFELIGLKQDSEPSYISDKPINIRDISRVRRSAFLEGLALPDIYTVANLRRVFGSRATVLYEAEVEDLKIPVVSEWRDRMTLAVFCGFGLSDDTVEAAEHAICYALREVDAPRQIMENCDYGVFWSINKNGYIVLSNISESECEASGQPGRSTFWDLENKKMLPDGTSQFVIPPDSAKVYRIVGKRSKFFDILGVSSLLKLIDGAGRAEIDILAGNKTTIVLRTSPKEILLDGKSCVITQEIINDAYHVTLQKCPPGRHRIALKW